MYVLAVVYSTETVGNSYYHDRDLLRVIVKAGNALIEAMSSRINSKVSTHREYVHSW